MRIISKKETGMVLENKNYKVRILYLGNDYEKELNSKKFSGNDVLVICEPKKETPFTIQFVFETACTEQDINIVFDETIYIRTYEIQFVSEVLMAAKETIKEIIEFLNTYFPGVIKKEIKF